MTIYFDPVSTSNLSNAVPGYSYWEYVIAMPEDSDGSSANGTSAAGLAAMGVLTFNDRGVLINQSAYTLDPTGTSGAAGTSLSSWVPATFSEDGLAQFRLHLWQQRRGHRRDPDHQLRFRDQLHQRVLADQRRGHGRIHRQ